MRDAPLPRVKDVLIAEDDDQVREILEDLLSGAGYRPIAAQDGAEALDWLSRMPVDLIIVDLLMPHMDGPQLIKHVRRAGRAPIPIIVLSGFAELDRFRGLPVDALLPKPFDIRALLSTVRRLIGTSGSASPLDLEDLPDPPPPVE